MMDSENPWLPPAAAAAMPSKQPASGSSPPGIVRQVFDPAGDAPLVRGLGWFCLSGIVPALLKCLDPDEPSKFLFLSVAAGMTGAGTACFLAAAAIRRKTTRP